MVGEKASIDPTPPITAIALPASMRSSPESTRARRAVSTCADTGSRWRLPASWPMCPWWQRYWTRSWWYFVTAAGVSGYWRNVCCHRGASLEFGKIAERGIQCCYHGWTFDIDGTILATPPSLPPADQGATLSGVLSGERVPGAGFRLSGPPDRIPAFPTYDCYERNDISLKTYTLYSPCNWLQIRENDLDTSHAKYLHTDLFGVQVAEVYTAEPVYDWRETPIGILSVSARRWKDKIFLRATDLIFPALGRFTAIEDAEGTTHHDRRGGTMSWCVPVDDTSSITFNILEIEESLPAPDRDASRPPGPQRYAVSNLRGGTRRQAVPSRSVKTRRATGTPGCHRPDQLPRA